MKIFFPYDTIRPQQDVLIQKIYETISNQSTLIVHAPTGLGKTAASLSPALSKLIEYRKQKRNVKIVFVTPRLTQHQIAVDTIHDLKKRYNINFLVTDVVGKKNMCLQDGVDILTSNQFSEFCKSLKEDKKCKYYENLKEEEDSVKLSALAKNAIFEIVHSDDKTVGNSKSICIKNNVCPYEILMTLAKKSQIIVADYFYIFSKSIQKNFLARINVELEDVILIVDEAHNLPSRIKSLMNQTLSTRSLRRAIHEASKLELHQIEDYLLEILHILESFSKQFTNINPEIFIKKDQFISLVNDIYDYDDLVELLDNTATSIKEKQKYSFIGSVSNFLSVWKDGKDVGFVRILVREFLNGKYNYKLIYNCIDPSLITKSVFENVHSAILMSGTLLPLSMYKEVLGLPKNTETLELVSPFRKENRLNLIIPKTSTKYTERNDNNFKQIAQIIAKITNTVQGNSAVFFPSYKLRDDIYIHLNSLSKKTVFLEVQNMSTTEKADFLNNFKKYSKVGAVLLGVSGGSFSEGIDLPGDLLKCVIVVGLPLPKPDLETKTIISYYNNLFGKGWDYGYVYPAFNKTLQSAGRCIRSDEDRGIIVFLDERYAWPNYYNCFPKEWNMKIVHDYEKEIIDFFKYSY